MDYEVIAYIRDEMLTDINLDADFVWSVSRLAEEDPKMYAMMSEYMQVSNSKYSSELIEEMKEYMEERGLYNG